VLKKTWIVLAILTAVIMVMVTGGIALADDGPGGATTLTKAQVFRRLLLLNEAKLDETLAKWVADGKITDAQKVQIKEAWQTARPQVVKAWVFKQLLKMNEAKVDETLGKWVAAGKIDAAESVKIKTAWQNARVIIRKIVIARQLLKMDAAKVDETLAKWLADGKITAGQMQQVRAWWVAKTTKLAN
jgi:hypothetical protein